MDFFNPIVVPLNYEEKQIIYVLKNRKVYI